MPWQILQYWIYFTPNERILIFSHLLRWLRLSYGRNWFMWCLAFCTEAFFFFFFPNKERGKETCKENIFGQYLQMVQGHAYAKPLLFVGSTEGFWILCFCDWSREATYRPPDAGLQAFCLFLLKVTKQQLRNGYQKHAYHLLCETEFGRKSEVPLYSELCKAPLPFLHPSLPCCCVTLVAIFHVVIILGIWQA